MTTHAGRWRVPAACAFAILLATPASAFPRLGLHWNDCGAGPATTVMTFLCEDDTSHFRLIGSVVFDSAVPGLKGMESWVDVLAAGNGPLPDFWQFGAGGCRQGSLTVSPTVHATASCPNLWSSGATGGFTFVADYPGETGNVGEIECLWATPAAAGVAVQPGTEYYAFEVDIDARHTTIADGTACAGCDQTMCIAFHRSILSWVDPNLPDTELRVTDANVSWRCGTEPVVVQGIGGPGGLTSCALGTCPTPTRRPTWGAVKALYR